MPKRFLILVFAILLWCTLKFLGVEVRQADAVAKSQVSSSQISENRVQPGVSRKPDALPPAPPARTNAALVSSQLRVKSRQEIYCRLRSAGVDVSASQIKLSFVDQGYAPEGQTLLKAFVQTPDCPADLFSKYELDSENRLVNSVNCHEISPKELYFGAGLQGAIVYTAERPGKVDVAISGTGFFVVRCENEYRYMRIGNWNYGADGNLLTKDGACEVLDRQGNPIILQAESDLDDRGCNSVGQCLAVASPESPEDFEIIDRKSFVALEDPLQHLVPEAYDTKIFTNSLESLKDPENGILGPDFSRIPYLDKPSFCPETF